MARHAVLVRGIGVRILDGERIVCPSGGMADTLDSKLSARKGVRVRLPSWVRYNLTLNDL